MSLKILTFVVVVPITSKVPPTNLRSILNPVSLVERSVHVKSNSVVEIASPVKFSGAAGTTLLKVILSKSAVFIDFFKSKTPPFPKINRVVLGCCLMTV